MSVISSNHEIRETACVHR